MVSKEMLEQFVEKGYTKKQVSEELQIGYSTVYRYMSKYGLSFKNRERKVRKVLDHKCHTCGDTNAKNFYSGRKIQCKSCFNKQCTDNQKTTKAKGVEFLGGKCRRCGYNKSMSALEFHHKDPTQKDPAYKLTWSWERLKPELEKCELLCANCHREVHEELRFN